MKHIGYKATDAKGYSFNVSEISGKKVKYKYVDKLDGGK